MESRNSKYFMAQSDPLSLDLDQVLTKNERSRVRMEIIAKDQLSKNLFSGHVASGQGPRPKSSVPFQNGRSSKFFSNIRGETKINDYYAIKLE